ncbi:Uncharacterized protein RNJ44_01438 [Nakaseomyces bracarensis]|uniref:Uncharacterized protein n=1 Tax=Nakaseomyces bracarensis TaxID=273131 RepID=A0ABR4NPP4_9SACH
MSEELGQLRRFVDQEEFDALTFLVLLEENCVNVRGNLHHALEYYSGLSEIITKQNGSNEELVWGLPKVLLSEIRESSIEDDELLRSIRQCLANASELGDKEHNLLFASESLKSYQVGEVDIYSDTNLLDGSQELVIRAFQLKIELMLELYIIPALASLSNPSKFLATVVSALMQLLVKNLNNQDYDLREALLNIVIFFYDNYTIPDLTGDIKTDELYIIDKILVSFWTFSINLCLKEKPCYAEVYQLAQTDKLNNLAEGNPMFDDKYVEKCRTIIRISQEKLGIDIVKKCHECIEETNNIYIKLPSEVDGNITSELTEEVYQMSYINGITMMETRQAKLLSDPVGSLALSAIHYIAYNKLPPISIGINDAIMLYIRFASASLYSTAFHNTFVEGICRFFLWNCIFNNSDSGLVLKKTIELLPEYMVKIFLQLLLLKTCNEATTSQKRMNFALITHILAFSNDTLAFEFILDTLLSCPYLEAKIAVAGLLKDLMSKNVSDFKIKTKSAKEVDPSEKKAPPLPHRPPIPVNEHRIASVHTLVKMCIEHARKPVNNKSQGNLILLQYYVNLLVTLHRHWDSVLLREINEDIEKQFNSRANDEFPEIEFIRINNAALAQCLNK